MPNANEIKAQDLKHNIMLLGTTGSGKTAQVLTLPGRTFCYLFDPNAIHTLVGHDVEYEEFVASEFNIAAQSLTKGRSDKATILKLEDIYGKFVDDINGKVSSGFFKEVDYVIFDSFTTFGDIVLDRVMELNGRLGQQPQQDDWAAQMITIKSVIRELIGQKVKVICTGHVEYKQDGEAGPYFNQIRLTGNLRTLMPLLFSDILFCDVDSAGKYTMQTMKDRKNPTIRCTLRDANGVKLPKIVDVTIPNEAWGDPKGYGLGALINNHHKGN